MSRERGNASLVLLRIGGPCALALLLVMMAAFLPMRVTPAQAQKAPGVVLIMSTTSGITDLSSDVVRSTFQGLRVEHRGLVLVPFNLPQQNPVRQKMDRALLGLEPSEVGRFWVDQRIRDGRNTPRTIPTIDLLVRVVAQLKGAIAGVPANQVAPQTRVIRIDGKSPSESGYLLADK